MQKRVLIYAITLICGTNAFLGYTTAPHTREVKNIGITPQNSIHQSSLERPNTVLFSTSSQVNEKVSVTSTLISNLAVVALKLRLAKQSSVTCDVKASSSKILLNGTVGPVSVKGRGWSSPLGLTCRAIDASVDTCMLDMNSVIKNRKLILIEPALGDAMVALNAADFGSFITHPLFAAEAPSLGDDRDGGLFEFLREGTEILVHEDQRNGGEVIFYGNCLGEKWRCSLQRGSKQSAHIQVMNASPSPTLVNGAMEAASKDVADMLLTFFNNLIFELDGTYLKFRDLMVRKPSKIRPNGGGAQARASEPTVMIALGIKVRKFPSPGLPF